MTDNNEDLEFNKDEWEEYNTDDIQPGDIEQNYGVQLFDPEHLINLGNYDSHFDPDALYMPSFGWTLKDEILTFEITEYHEAGGNNPISEIDRFPESCDFVHNEDQENIFVIKMPLDSVMLIELSSDLYDFAMNIPGSYGCKISLNDGQKISIEGTLIEAFNEGSTLPDYFYYLHKVNII